VLGLVLGGVRKQVGWGPSERRHFVLRLTPGHGAQTWSPVFLATAAALDTSAALSPVQAKRLAMNSRVEVLRLETALDREQGTLRRLREIGATEDKSLSEPPPPLLGCAQAAPKPGLTRVV